MRLRRAVLHGDHVARFHRGRPGGRAACVPRAPTAVRRAPGSGRRMSPLTERTRLGLEVLATGVVLGIAGDALLRVTPWGLNAFLCTVALAAAAAGLVYRRRIAVGRDAPWLAIAAVLLGSNFATRDADALRALDAMGLAILLALAGLSLRGVALRGRDAWEYARSVVVAALSAWFGVWPLMARDIRWSELPTGGALRHARGAVIGALLAFPLLIAFGGLFAAADPVFRNVVATALHVDFSAVASHLALTALWTALTAGYFWGALIRRTPPPAADAQALSLGIVPVGTALGLVNLLFLVFVVIQLRYFFGGAELVQNATDLTYAEYARRGFFELVAASGLVLPFLLGADWQLRDAAREHQRTLRQLSGLLLALLGVVIASALQRMRLYVAEFGLSEIRLYATAFMIYLAGAFAWFAWTVLRGHWRRFAFGAVVQGFAVLGGLHLLNPDAFIVRTNLARPAAHRPFDAAYAASLGADAVPDLLAGFAGLEDQQHGRPAAALLARWTPEGSGGSGPSGTAGGTGTWPAPGRAAPYRSSERVSEHTRARSYSHDHRRPEPAQPPDVPRAGRRIGGGRAPHCAFSRPQPPRS